jgi:hypothetical protein
MASAAYDQEREGHTAETGWQPPPTSGARTWLTPAVRVRSFTGLIALAAVAIYLGFVRDLQPPPTPFAIPWPLAAFAFYLGETKVVEVHFLRERHSFSLSELPGIFGLFFLAPNDYLLALMVGTGVGLLAHSRRSAMKGAFNLAQFALVPSLTVFHAIASTRPHRPGRVAAFAAGHERDRSLLVDRDLLGGPPVAEAAPDAELQRDGRARQQQPACWP